jgi:hypothetical protein
MKLEENVDDLNIKATIDVRTPANAQDGLRQCSKTVVIPQTAVHVGFLANVQHEVGQDSETAVMP